MRNDILYYHEVEEYPHEENEYQIFFDFTAWYTPARLSGPPEDCYPEEGDSEYEIESVKLNGVTVAISDIPPEVLKLIDNKVSQWVEENGIAYIAENNMDYDDYRDDRPDYLYEYE